jgi:predicted DNA-binding transcriptional regulator AlpA
MKRTSMDDTYIPKYRLETHAQLEARLDRSRSTLCAMRDPGDPRFDPTFPEPIPVGPPRNPYASIRFDASEVDDWIKSRMDMRPGITTRRGCTRATSYTPVEIPCVTSRSPREPP